MFKKKEEIKLGKQAMDKITGFAGIITARSEYLYGCDQYLITPQAETNEYKDSVWVDEGRLEIIADGIEPETVQTEKNGGMERKVRY